jgi:uncharacterized YigZ family protein
LYKTIIGQAQAEFTEKKSKFISYAKHIETPDEAVNFIDNIKTKHWDATHNVYAYILKLNQIQKYSDDGEPRGTAGVPVLNVILNSQLYDLVVVVTRYFGGTMLGAGGLIRAYSLGCKKVIQVAKIITVHKCREVSIKCEYNAFSKIKQLLTNYSHKIVNIGYDNDVILNIIIHESAYGKLLEDVRNITNGASIVQSIRTLDASLMD